MGARLPLVLGGVAAAATFALIVSTGSDRAASEPAARTAQVAGGRVVFARMGCGGCHQLSAARSAGGVGPSLDAQLRGHDRASLTASIVDPYRDGPPTEFATMPENFGERMTPAELEALVTFLLDAR